MTDDNGAENVGKKDCALLWFTRDFRGSEKVQSMDWAEQGMYRHLLDMAWENGGIPADREELRGILKLERDAFRLAWRKIGKCFVKHPTDARRLVNTRQEKERAIRSAVKEKRRQASAVGNLIRWGDRSAVANGIPNGVANGSQGDRLSPSQSLSPSQRPSHPSESTDIRTSALSVPLGERAGSESVREPEGGEGRDREGLPGAGGERAVWDFLRLVRYRENSPHRDRELTQKAGELVELRTAVPDLLRVFQRVSRRKGVRDPYAVFAALLNNPGELLKEIAKS